MEAQGRVRVTLSPIAALALELEGSAQRAVVPTFRRAHSTQALVAPLDRQIQEIEHEAGVRKNL